MSQLRRWLFTLPVAFGLLFLSIDHDLQAFSGYDTLTGFHCGKCHAGRQVAGKDTYDADYKRQFIAAGYNIVCGNGYKEGTTERNNLEECDDGNTSDTDACLSNCKNAKCGDGKVQAEVEQCDKGADNSNAANAACRTDCKNRRCGDGIVDSGESCDDGNASDADACLSTCKKNACGDGKVHAGVEECDDGNKESDDGCSSTCTSEAAAPTTLVVKNLDDAAAGSPPVADSLRDAVKKIAQDGTISFDSAVTGTIKLTGGEIEIKKNMTITGPGAHVLAISGNNSKRIFNIQPGKTVSISGLKLTNGFAEGADGGAIYNLGDSLTLTDCVVAYNKASAGQFGVGGNGGAIYSSGTLTLNRVIVGDLVNLKGSTIGNVYGNRADGSGGGIYNSSGTLNLINSMVAGNGSMRSGGGIYSSGGTVKLLNSSLISNTVNIPKDGETTAKGSSTGGGLYGGSSTVTIKDSILHNNINEAMPLSSGVYTPDDCDTRNVTFQGYNILGDNSQGRCITVAGTPTQTDPKTEIFERGEGRPLIYKLQSDSPAIDKGDCKGFDGAASDLLKVDQAGKKRDSLCDAGAYEFETVCGDGNKQGSEECDDGNKDDNDKCSSACKTEKCGDGIKQASEACDDGNSVDDDDCSNSCTIVIKIAGENTTTTGGTSTTTGGTTTTTGEAAVAAVETSTTGGSTTTTATNDTTTNATTTATTVGEAAPEVKTEALHMTEISAGRTAIPEAKEIRKLEQAFAMKEPDQDAEIQEEADDIQLEGQAPESKIITGIAPSQEEGNAAVGEKQRVGTEIQTDQGGGSAEKSGGGSGGCSLDPSAETPGPLGTTLLFVATLILSLGIRKMRSLSQGRLQFQRAPVRAFYRRGFGRDRG